ncbi:Pentatricopeptide repeat-containing protein [Spatholobus suberectus]|nr:Pentatricopeptide repeat-containing protein [Spatholobus suberectus]
MGAREVSRVLFRCLSDHSSALTFFNWVKNDLNITPTVHNYCGVSPTDDIYESLVGCNCNCNPVIFDMLIKAYVKAGMVKKGLTTFRKNIEACFIPIVNACNCLLSGLSRFNYIGQCWEVYEEMGRLGRHRNAYTFNIMTHVLCKNGDIDK